MPFPVGARPARKLSPAEEKELYMQAQASQQPVYSGPPHLGEPPVPIDGAPPLQVSPAAFVGERPMPPSILPPVPLATPADKPYLYQRIEEQKTGQPTPEQINAQMAGEQPPLPPKKTLAGLVGDRPAPAAAQTTSLVSSAQDTYQKAQADYNEAFNRPTKDTNGRLRSVLKMAGVALEGFKRFPRGGDWGDFARSAAEVGGTALGTAINPSADEEYGRARDLDVRGRHLETAREAVNTESQLRNRESLMTAREERQKLARSSQELRRLHQQWQRKSGDRRLSNSEKAQKFREEMARKGYDLKMDQFEFDQWYKEEILSDRDATHELATRRERRQAEEGARRLQLAERREQRIRETAGKGGSKEEIARQIAEIDRDSALEEANSYAQRAAELEATGDEEDREDAADLRRKERQARAKAAKSDVKMGGTGDLSNYSREDVVARAKKRFPNDPVMQKRIVDEWVKKSIPFSVPLLQ